MKQTIQRILDIIFPIRKDAQLVASCTHEDLKQLHRLNETDHIVWLLPFADERVRACIHEVKFHDNQVAVQLLADALTTYFESQCNDNVLIIPIPLSKDRLRSRGYNQVVRIASGIRNIHIDQEILYRIKDTAPQTTLSKKERLQNVKDAFAVCNTVNVQKKIEGKHVILLDDVYTTGATLRAAKASLLPLHPASVTCVALAH